MGTTKKGQGQKKAAPKGEGEKATAPGQSNAIVAGDSPTVSSAASSGFPVVAAPPPKVLPPMPLTDPSHETSTYSLSQLYMDDRSEESRLLADTFEEGRVERMDTGERGAAEPAPLQDSNSISPAAAPKKKLRNAVVRAPHFYEVRMGPNLDKPAPKPAAFTIRETGVQACLGDGCLIDALNGYHARGEDPQRQWTDLMTSNIKITVHPKGDPNLPPIAPPARNPDGEVPAARPRQRGSRGTRGRGRKNKNKGADLRKRQDAAQSTPKAAKVAKGGDRAENPPDSAGPSLNSTTQGAADAASPPDPDLSAIDPTRQDPQKQTASQRGKNKKRPRSESLVSNDARGRGGKRGKGFHRGSHSSSASHYAP